MKIGTSEKLITPEPGIELCGYLLREQPSTGKYDELYARTLYLESIGNKIVWIHCDLIGFSNELAWHIRNAVAKVLAIDAVNVVLSATHTHAGPATVFLRKCGDINPAYVEFLEKTIIDSVKDALRNIEEVIMHFSESVVEGISVDRTKSPENSHVDNALPVLAFKREDGTFKAVFTNFAIHNVGLSGANRKISSDIAGFAAARASFLIKGSPAVFLTNGGCGNINPVLVAEDYSGVEKAGTVLGDSIAAGISPLTKCSDCAVSASFAELELPLNVISKEELAKILDNHRRNFDAGEDNSLTRRFREAIRIWSEETIEIIENKRPLKPAMAYAHILKIGPLTLVGINAEVFSKMAEQLRALTGIKKLYVVGYADGCIGYLAPAENHKEGGYAVGEAHKFYAHFGLKSGSFEMLRDCIAKKLLNK
ncbi:MAG: neutral/alkaline non-lysosomal ceramidase N-terminal domain-containing protein [Victivallaceae bacterium]|jgi:hypothetical protein